MNKYKKNQVIGASASACLLLASGCSWFVVTTGYCSIAESEWDFTEIISGGVMIASCILPALLTGLLGFTAAGDVLANYRRARDGDFEGHVEFKL